MSEQDDYAEPDPSGTRWWRVVALGLACLGVSAAIWHNDILIWAFTVLNIET